LVLHRTRYLLIRRQTSVINAIRAHLAEFGITAPVGRRGFEELLRVVADPSDKRVPELVRSCRDLIRGGHYGQLLWTIKSLILWPFVGENG
jgi:transposase